MDSTQSTEPARTESNKIFIACICCKSRKRRCDGGTPKCANCIARGAECNYVAVRKTRGPGKKRSQAEILEKRLNTTQHLSSRTLMPDNDDFGPDTRGDTIISTIPSKILEESRLHDGFLVKQSNIVQSATPMKPSQTQVNVWAHIPIFPEFLLPGTFDEHLRKFKRIVAESIPAQKFMPLMPPHISRRLIENSFGDIMSEYQLLDLSNFVELLDAQYAASSLGPAGNPARWTVVNAIVALAVRAKTAPGSENALSGITHGFYQNATRVLPELILQDPCLLSIQTLLAMAMFARCIPDVRAFIMLATNASRQLELLTLNLLSTAPAIGMKVAKQYEEVYRTSNVFDKNISEFLNTEAALQQGQAQLTQPESQSEGQADAVSLYSI